MAIDNCRHTFNKLARKVFPAYLKELRESIRNPIPMNTFAARGVGKKRAFRKAGRTSDFSGCYVLVQGKKPIYVGISRTVLQRLLQHVKGKTHFDSSLAYRMALGPDRRRITRSRRMASARFRRLFDRKKEFIATLNVAYVEIENPLELHLFELFCAMALDTHRWNTFRTH